MDSARCAALCVLLTACLFAVTRAHNDEKCLIARFVAEGCIDNAKFNFKRLDRTSYKRRLCRGIKPMSDCITQNRQNCPHIPIFQGDSGQAVDALMDTISQVCLSGSPQQGGAGQGSCKGNKKKFRRRIGRCHEPMNVALKEDQMCGPMENITQCMTKQLSNYRACPWMVDAIAHQVQFGIDYYKASRLIRYHCE